MSSDLCEDILVSHHELSQNFESKSFGRFLKNHFDIKVISSLNLNKLFLPLSKIWSYWLVLKIFNPNVTLRRRIKPKKSSMSNVIFSERTPQED